MILGDDSDADTEDSDNDKPRVAKGKRMGGRAGPSSMSDNNAIAPKSSGAGSSQYSGATPNWDHPVWQEVGRRT
jgi:hypothetical protein